MAVVLDNMQLQLDQHFPEALQLRHLHSAVDFSQVTVGYHLWWLIADTNLEASRTPVHELNCALRLQSSHSAVDILGDYVTTVEQAGSHIFPIARVAFHHLVVGLEAGHRDLLHRIGFV